jgi:IS30 family transposase
MRDYTQLTSEERYQIEALLKADHNQTEIASVLKRHKSTISREVGHNRGFHGYRPHASLVHTLTSDNGKEFSHHQVVAEELNADGHFAHPCHSWERGLNENTNGLIRQYLPPKARTSRRSHTRRSKASWTNSTTGPANALASRRPIRYSLGSNHLLH